MTALGDVARRKLRDLEERGLHRTPVTTARLGGARVERGGRRLLSFSCNDYLALTHDPAVTRAARDALERYGTGAGASRLITGNHPLYDALEDRLRGLYAREAACVFGSGYLTNVGVIPALVGSEDLVLVDELSHACIHAGARLSGATRHVFRHGDAGHCEALLAERRGQHRHCLIATDVVFSMDGDRAPLAELTAVARRHDAWLLADDAHGLGLLSDPVGEDGSPDLVVGTLSKALASAGGFCCADEPVVDLLRSRARSAVYSTGLPPASAAAALASLETLAADPERRRRPVERARLFARELGLPLPASAIVPLILGSTGAALRASRRLEEGGYLAVAIRPPTVPEGTSRLRFTFSAAHSEADVLALAAAVRELDLPVRAPSSRG